MLVAELFRGPYFFCGLSLRVEVLGRVKVWTFCTLLLSSAAKIRCSSVDSPSVILNESVLLDVAYWICVEERSRDFVYCSCRLVDVVRVTEGACPGRVRGWIGVPFTGCEDKGTVLERKIEHGVPPFPLFNTIEWHTHAITLRPVCLCC